MIRQGNQYFYNSAAAGAALDLKFAVMFVDDSSYDQQS
jgi:hypothetical protein